MLSVKTKEPEETFALGERLAPYLRPGMIITLSGELGAGKTIFAKGMAKGFRVAEQVTSPTFTIINEYQGTLPLYHIDAYRLEENSEEEIEELGLDEYFYSSGITLIEWPEMINNYLPQSYLRINIEKIMDESGSELRVVNFTPIGNAWDNVIGEFKDNESIGN